MKKNKVQRNHAELAANIILAMVDLAAEGEPDDGYFNTDFVQGIADAVQADGTVPDVEDFHKLAFEGALPEVVDAKLRRKHKNLLKRLQALFG